MSNQDGLHFDKAQQQQYEFMPYYIKKTQTQTPKYRDKAENGYRNGRRTDKFDYNYEDWENDQPNYYNFFISNVTSTAQTQTETLLTTVTTPATTTTESTIETNNDTLVTDTIGTANVTLTLFTPSSTLTIPEFPDFSDDIFHRETTTTTVKPEKNPFVDEIKRVRTKIREGIFTSSLIVLLREISLKDPEDLKHLLTGFNDEVKRLNAERKLLMFGEIVLGAFTSMAYLSSVARMENVQEQAKFGIGLIEKRREYFRPDSNAIIDVADVIFNDEDLQNIANFIRDVHQFPNIDKAPSQVAGDGIDAFILIPYKRTEGTDQQKLLVQEIENAVKHRLFTDGGIGEVRRRAGGEKETLRRSYFLKIAKIFFKTVTPISTTAYMEYVRNATIMKRVKQRMKIYKDKFKIINKKEKASKRGPTTTTTSTTTTIIPPMVKSKYYIRKYVKKDLYKMRTTTKKTTTFRIRYYGKIRKFNIDGDDKLTDTEHSTDSDNEGYYSDYEIANSKLQTDISSEIIEQKTIKQKTEPYLNAIKLNSDNNAATIRHHSIHSKRYKSIDKGTDVDETEYIKANILNAMIHRDTEDKRRFLTSTTYSDSLSDYEVELKRNLYRAMNVA